MPPPDELKKPFAVPICVVKEGCFKGCFKRFCLTQDTFLFVDLRLPGFETGEQKKWVHYLMEGEAMLIDKEDLSEMQMSMIAHG